jgi:uncharacterized protein (DUF1778 family)
MATQSNYALRVPPSLMEEVRVAAVRDGQSLNSFIVQALAEKVASLRTRGLLNDMSPEDQRAWLASRAGRGDRTRLLELLAKAGTTAEIRPGDEIPEGYLDPPASR